MSFQNRMRSANQITEQKEVWSKIADKMNL